MARIRYDVTRSTEAARKSSRRAEIKLARQFEDIGQMANEMRYNLSEIRREQAHLKNELRVLRVEAAKSARNLGKIHHAEPELGDHTEARHAPVSHRACTAVAKKTDFGKNFYGYHSAPGSHTKYTRTASDIESSLEDYYHKIDDRLQAEKTAQQLKEQKKRNTEVAKSVETWKTKNPSAGTRRKFSITEPPNLRHLALLRDELMHKEHEVGDKEVSAISAVEQKRSTPSSSKNVTILPPDHKELVIESPVLSNNHCEKNKKSEAEIPDQAHNKENKQASPPIFKYQSDDLVFDAELYAPDGKVRTAHRLPDFEMSFNEARKAKYVRTKEKRPFERHMSVSEVFK